MSIDIERGVFDGLRSYEIVLLVLGVLFFLILVSLLIYLAVTNKNYGKIAALLLVPVIMIAFPSIKKVEFGKDIGEIDKLVKKVEQNPANAKAKTELESRLKTIENRRISNPGSLRIMEKAYTAVGDLKKAETYRKPMNVKTEKD